MSQSQDSVREQMIRLYRIACEAGLYDAADAIRKLWIDTP